MKRIEVTGLKFGRLTVLGDAPTRISPGGRTLRMVDCACGCGTIRAYQLQSLRSGIAVSCGCSRLTRDGMATSREYDTWMSMLHRCSNSAVKAYKNYGGRGISVCARWADPVTGFASFSADMGHRPPGMTLDRQDNDGNYEPDNCRWATPTEQGNNRRNNCRIEIGGVSKTAAEWSDETGLLSATIRRRLNARWDASRLLTPVNKSSKEKSPASI